MTEEKNTEETGEIEPMSNDGGKTEPRVDVKDLLRKNLELNAEIFEMVKYIKKYIIWQRIWGIFKILIIVVPITLSIIYLPPLLGGLYDQYKGLFESAGIKLPEEFNMGSVQNMLKPQVSEISIENMTEEQRQQILEYLENNPK